jgi:hypothetical protein
MDSASTLRVDDLLVTRQTLHAKPAVQRGSAKSVLLVIALTCSMIVNVSIDFQPVYSESKRYFC